jgi:hypothetical protein
MGQYWKPVNIDKREFLDPHKLGCGLKLWEQIANFNSPGVGTALTILLAVMPEKRGGGDLNANPFIGRWAGDRVVLVGDYSTDEDMPNSPIPFGSVYAHTHTYEKDEKGITPFVDITDDVIEIIEGELGGVYVGDGWRKWEPTT